VHSVKAVRFQYDASKELSSLFEEFRLMCNDAIRIALNHKPRNRLKLTELAYTRLKEYGLHTHYILSACEVAYSVFKNAKRKADPFIRKHFIKLDSQTYRLNHLVLRIPTRPRHFVYLTLHGSDYHLSLVDDPRLKRGSITLTDSILAVALSRETAEIATHGRIGIDVNERNVTWADSSGLVGKEDTSAVAELKERYKAVRAKMPSARARTSESNEGFSQSTEDARETERPRQSTESPRESCTRAKTNGQIIIMENLKGIRKLYRRGNGQGRSFRGRMNSWTFHEDQRQIDYKARWEGVPVYYVNPRNTSRKCPTCGSSLVELEGRQLRCPSCKKTEDRDVVASKNLLACAVPQARPSG